VPEKVVATGLKCFIFGLVLGYHADFTFPFKAHLSGAS